MSARLTPYIRCLFSGWTPNRKNPPAGSGIWQLALLGLACCLVLLVCTTSHAAPMLNLRNADSYPLGGAQVEILEDPGCILTIDDVASSRFATRFVPSRDKIPNFGITNSAFWFRFTIDPGLRRGDNWLLLLDQPLMNLVDLYVPRGDGRYDIEHSGNHIPMSRRDVRSKHILLPLPLDSAPRTFYLRTWIGGRAQVPLTVLTRGAFHRLDSSENFIFGAYAGFMLVMVLMGICLFALLRDRNYLYYALYAAGMLLVLIGMNGYLYAYLLPEYPQLHEYLILMLCSLTILAGLVFARRFLRLAEYSPPFDRIFSWLVALNLLMVPLCHIMPALFYKKLLNFNLLLATSMALVAACVCYRRGFLPAGFYACGRLSLSIGGLVYPLVNEAVLPVNLITQNALLLASVGDLLFMLLALGYHFYVMSSQVRTLVTDLEHEVDERAAAHRALKEQMSERERLEQEIERVGREERRRISHELHDGLCQQLTGARLRFAALEDRLAVAGMHDEAQPLGALLQECVEHAYALSRRLCSSDPSCNEISDDLEELAGQIAAQTTIPIRVTVARNCPVCSSASIAQLHLIAREAMINAVKHSEATLITVILDCTAGSGIRLEVRDNGRGISAAGRAGGGMGVGIMEYRAAKIGGRIDITDGEGGGTCLTCVAPCSETAPKEAADA